MRVYNLVSEENAIKNIRNRRLKISTINDLNDPYELMGLQLINKDYRKVFKQRRAEFAKKFGVLCFSKSWRNPVLWGHYGDKHAGVCLGFDVPDTLLKDVNYYSSLRCMESDIEVRQPQIGTELLHELLYWKFQDWSYEEETRFLVKLDTCDKDGALYFYPFSDDLVLREFIIGACCKKASQDIVGLIKPFTKGVEIIKSRLAFKDYRVVRNKQYKIVKI